MADSLHLGYTGDTKRITTKSEEQVLVRHGKGTYVWSSAFSYTGDWVNNKKHGKGIFRMPDSSSYEGDFRDGEMEGHGVRKFADGSSFEGDFHLGEFHGQGVFKGRFGEYNGSYFCCDSSAPS